ncbi:S41 family peptidase [Flavobacteriaceae bacterium MHTCC 0001]
MKKIKTLVLILATLVLTGCFDDRDDLTSPEGLQSNLNNFVWKAMNTTYLYKSEIPNLADNRFGSNEEYNDYLSSFDAPESLFESLIYQREAVDRFSRIYPDYIALEQLLSGTFKTNGMEFSLFAAPNSDTDLVAVVRLVLKGSDADNKGVKRGDLFSQINGTIITRTNTNNLFNQDNYTINLGDYNDNGTTETSDDSITLNGTNISLEKSQFTENPIYINEVFQVGGESVGYLMYNGFTSGSENELNTVFGNFKSSNVQHLILDLRYNPGGSVRTTTFLASMITGQFNGQVFERLVYNNNLQDLNFDYLFSDRIGGNTINSLGLNKLYVLTTSRTASASEGIINSLRPYIDVIQVGTETTGKTQASTILYDSPDFSREGVTPAHTYALRPLIANGVNKNNEAVPGTGIPPSIGFDYTERSLNLGVLGDINEPLLALAITDIENSLSKRSQIKSKPALLKAAHMDEHEFSLFEEGPGGMIAD